jgi:DNA-binding phage protein
MFVLLHAFPKKTQKHLSEKSIKPFVKLKILGKGGLMMNNNAIGESWEEVKKELFSPEEIIEIDASAALMEQLIEARQAQGISQKRLEELSGVSQPVIARMEKGITSPQLSTLLKVLRPLGLTLKIVPVPKT